MEIKTKYPLKTFLETIGKKTAGELCIISPFISKPAATYLLEYVAPSNLNLNIVTNLDKFLISISLYDPISPLLLILDEFKKKIIIKNCNQLHAKMYYLKDIIACFGSSNLTLGGMESNIEFNTIIKNTYGDKKYIQEIDTWISQLWNNYSVPVTKKKLKELHKYWKYQWEKNLSITGMNYPDPNLAGDDLFGKIKNLLRKSYWTYSDVNKLLKEKEKSENNTNTRNKLIFLQDIGVVESFNEKNVVVNKKRRDDFIDPYRLLNIIRDYIYDPIALLEFINIKKKVTYKEIEKELKVSQEKDKYRVSIHWLSSLEFLKIENKGYYEISITKKGKQLLGA